MLIHACRTVRTSLLNGGAGSIGCASFDLAGPCARCTAATWSAYFGTSFESRQVGRLGKGSGTDDKTKTGGKPRHREISDNQVHGDEPSRCGNH